MFLPFNFIPKMIRLTALFFTVLNAIGISKTIAQDHSTFDVTFGTERNNCDQPEGIYHATFSSEAMRLSPATLIQPLNGAGWLTYHPTKLDVLYCTGDVRHSASVVAISVEGQSANIINSEPIDDGGSCFLTTDNTGSILISAQYGGGSVAVFPLASDGTIGKRSQLIEHSAVKKTVANNQDAPHPHYVAISPDNRFAFVLDLGLDQLIAYKIDLENKKLLPHVNVDVIPDGGPRHMKFHPGGKFVFVLNELALSVTVFRYEAETGTMEKVETVETLTAEEKSENQSNSASEIRVTNGQVFAGNRGDDSISVFDFDEETAKLIRTQVAPIHGSWPRNFNLTPDGKFLIAAGKDSNTASIFAIRDGKLLHLVGKSVFVPAPICVSIRPKVNK